MAITGIKKPRFAPITTYAAGSRPVYGDAVTLGHAIKVDLSIETSDAELYGDNILIESDSEFNRVAISFGTDQISAENEAEVFGSTYKDGMLLDAANDIAAEGGFGYYKTIVKSGVRSYEAVFLYRVKFKKYAKNAGTKTNTTTYQTPEIEGTGMIVEDWKGGAYRLSKVFSSESEADEFIDDCFTGEVEEPENV